MQKTILPPPISFETSQRFQVVPSTRGDVILTIPSPKPPTTHPYRVLNFLTEFRNDSLKAYLSAITLEQYGAATFLEGGLGGIDVVINNKPPYVEWIQKGETCLKDALMQQDWATANWWKGFACGLEIADRVQRASWYDACRWDDRLLEWLDRTRGKIA